MIVNNKPLVHHKCLFVLFLDMCSTVDAVAIIIQLLASENPLFNVMYFLRMQMCIS